MCGSVAVIRVLGIAKGRRRMRARIIFEWPSRMLQLWHSVNGGSRKQLPIFLLLCMAFALSAAVLCADENHKPVRT